MTETDISGTAPEDTAADAPAAEASDSAAQPAPDDGNSAIDAVKDFVRDHPVAVVAGGLVLGLVAASLLPKGTARKFARRAVTLAEVASAAGVLFGQKAWEHAESAGHDLRDLGHGAVGRAERFGGQAANRMHDLVSPVEQAAVSAGQKVAESAARLASKVRR